jgi:hypothetical protein
LSAFAEVVQVELRDVLAVLWHMQALEHAGRLDQIVAVCP